MLNAHIFGHFDYLREIVPDRGLSSGQLNAAGAVDVIDDRLEHPSYGFHVGVEIIPAAVCRCEAYRTIQIASVGHLGDHETGMLQMPLAEAAFLRTVLYLTHRSFLRRFGNSRELIEILVILGAGPDLDLPLPVVRAALDDEDIIALLNLVRMYGPQAHRAQGIRLTYLISH
ncbi:hypothetical protein SDC9_159376 [bioreactor metagenome]|uniref:Uncharacterized protein n=1 Tax=bioreactor metagenome TaxID=1076179 RepID=A0A645FEP1_9ZZZZ